MEIEYLHRNTTLFLLSEAEEKFREFYESLERDGLTGDNKFAVLILRDSHEVTVMGNVSCDPNLILEWMKQRKDKKNLDVFERMAKENEVYHINVIKINNVKFYIWTNTETNEQFIR